MSNQDLPKVVSTVTTDNYIKSNNIVSNNNSPMLSDSNNYEVQIDQVGASIFKNEIKNVRKGKYKKRKFQTTNLKKYNEAVSHLDSAMLAAQLGGAINEYKALGLVKSKLNNKINYNEFYKFDNKIKCSLLKDGKYYDSMVIGIDSGKNLLVDSNNKKYSIDIKENLKITNTDSTKNIKGGNRNSSSSVNKTSSNIPSSSQKLSTTYEPSSSVNLSSEYKSNSTSINSSSHKTSSENNIIDSSSQYLTTSEYNLAKATIDNHTHYVTSSTNNYSTSNVESVNSPLKGGGKSKNKKMTAGFLNMNPLDSVSYYSTSSSSPADYSICE